MHTKHLLKFQLYLVSISILTLFIWCKQFRLGFLVTTYSQVIRWHIDCVVASLVNEHWVFVKCWIEKSFHFSVLLFLLKLFSSFALNILRGIVLDYMVHARTRTHYCLIDIIYSISTILVFLIHVMRRHILSGVLTIIGN